MGQQIQLQKKILNGPHQRPPKQKMNHGPPISLQDRRKAQKLTQDNDQDDEKKTKQQKKAEYYKFYLDNAQKAIDLMIQQHKSVGSLARPGARNVGNIRGHSVSSQGRISLDDQGGQGFDRFG